MGLKKRAVQALAAALAASALCACGANPPEAQDGVPPQAVHALGLTAEQRMEDYEAFWSGLRDSYPCWGILEREGVDVDAIYEEYRELVEENDSDVSFYSALYSALWRLGRNGHLWLVEPEEYNAAMAEIGLYEKAGLDRWAETLQSPGTAAGYRNLETMLSLMGEGGGGDGAAQSAVIKQAVLPGDIGYLKLDGFTGDLETDGAVLRDFYDRCADCGDLIFDLTENSGGSEDYWEQLLVAPNIDAPLTDSRTALVRMSENNAPYLESAFTPAELHPISELGALPALHAADRALATHFVSITHAVSPAAARSPFHGRIWVLVSGAVYSASESFAIFCKDTGFAALVGTQTGGDGVGISPIYLQLPNSRLPVQFTALFGLNEDGGSNEERGTAPDILSPDGEPPLVTALRAIEEERRLR